MKMGRGAKARRGIAGIVAIVIIFAIMFSVGTSYYIYVNSQNAAYSTSLLAAANKIQGRQTESLTVATLLEPDGDVGFFANDTSSITVNMTAVLVLSSTGALLKCDGVGFPAGSGCSNSTPTLWETIDAGKGSSTIDTGYVYSPGTTDTLKVLTARGNTYTQTYPEPASDTGSTQAVSVNLDNLKWVQLIPEASSLVQKNYVANCNSQNCALAYSSSVTAGNILVDAVGWANNAPPSGVPTDTRGDVFHLGTSSSVAVSASPALVQDKYTSNCNAATCGLAFTSSVTAGHTLVYAVGWANQSPPSAPTDTRGDTFTLGASQSVGVNPGTPALVQDKYTSNCNSASCGLAYGSSVTAGNTLLYSLGWYGQSPPSTPTDTLGDTFTLGASNSVQTGTFTPALVQDRYNSNCNSATCSLAYSSSVTAGNTLVFGLGWYGQSPPSTPTDTLGDTFTLGASNSVQVGGSGSLAIDGSNSAESGSASSIAATLTTSHTNDVIIAYVSPVTQEPTAPPTVSSISGGGLTWHSRETGAVEDGAEYYQNVDEWYAVASSTLSSATITATLSGTANQEVWITVFGISGANTASPFDPNTSVPATNAATSNPSTTMSTSNADDMLIYACSAYAGSNPSGWTSVEANNGYSIDEYVAYKTVTSTQTNLATSCGGSDAYGAEVTDAVEAATTYYSYVWYATAATSGADTISASFSSAVTGSVSMYEFSGVTTTGALTSTGSSSAGSNTATVTSFTPTSGSVVIGNAETNAGTTFSNGGGYTLVATCNTVYGCSEYETASSGSTTVSTNLGTSPAWVEAAISFAPLPKTYYSYIWYGTAQSSGADTITASFAATVAGTISIYEISGYSTSSTQSSTGSSSAGSTSAGVSSFTPSSNSFVLGNVETGSASTKYTVGSGYTTIASGSGGCDASDAAEGCNEYETGLGSATQTLFTLSASTAWVEAAMSFAPLSASTYYSYIYYATAASSGADTISASFGSTVAGSVSIYEISGVTATGLLTSTGSSSASGASTSVTSVTPTLAGSVVVGDTETTSTTYTAGSGYTLSGSCSSVSGCGEYQTGVGTATMVPMSISPSAPWVEAAVVLSPVVSDYYSYIWYATAGTSGSNTITTAFASTVAGSVSIYEINGYTTSNFLTSTGSSSTGSTGAAVTAYTPATDSFIVGNAEGASSSNAFTAGTGFTLGGTCSSVEGCSEYDSSNSDGGAANTVPITLGTSTPWAEASMSFSTPFNPQSGIQVGGYPTMGVPASAVLVWEATFTNVDSQHRALTLWPQSEIAIGSKESNTYDLGYIQAHYYIIDGLNPGSTTVNAYTSTTGGQFLTLAWNVPTTIYFAATAALGSTTQPFGNNYGTPFEAYFALTGIFSDGTLMGETVPYPYGIITESNAYTTPTAGSTGATVTVSCTAPCDFDASSTAIVGWINSEGQMTTLATFTTTASGNIPSGVTFSVPTATAGYYTIEVTDYVNAVFMTFQHT